MSRPRKPWLRKSNKCWYVEIDGKQVNLGRNKTAAHRRFHALMAEPIATVPNGPDITFTEIADQFLEWVKQNRAVDTFEWYQQRIERFCRRQRITTADHPVQVSQQ
ncbi:MAG: hypothetical protein KDA86_25490 [Planctomycetaceae bacterium]|nr:hypothetical protein [Planctomycetaceae bacterium]